MLSDDYFLLCLSNKAYHNSITLDFLNIAVFCLVLGSEKSVMQRLVSHWMLLLGACMHFFDLAIKLSPFSGPKRIVFPQGFQKCIISIKIFIQIEQCVISNPICVIIFISKHSEPTLCSASYHYACPQPPTNAPNKHIYLFYVHKTNL